MENISYRNPLGDGGAVLVNGNTYLSANGSAGSYTNQNAGYSNGNGSYANGISNGYINPDVIPIHQPARPPSQEGAGGDQGGFIGNTTQPRGGMGDS